MMIRRRNGKKAHAEYVRHVRTLTGTPGQGNDDVDLYRLRDGSEVLCIAPAGDCRVMPREVSSDADHFPGHHPGN